MAADDPAGDPVESLRAKLRLLYDRVHNPAYRRLSIHAEQEGLALPTSTTGDLLNGQGVPRWETVEAFVRACARYAKIHRQPIPQELLDINLWLAAYRAVRKDSDRESRAKGGPEQRARGDERSDLARLLAARSRRVAPTDGPRQIALDKLRSAVSAMWTRRYLARQTYLPRALRLTWRPMSRVGLQAAGTLSDPASLVVRPDDPDAQMPAASKLVEAFRNPGLRQLVLLGEAGAGKSTLVAFYVATAAAAGSGNDAVPVLLSLAAWDPGPADAVVPTNDLQAWITEQICRDYPPLSPPDARLLVTDRRVIAVLDGLDEVPAALRGRALTELEELAAMGLRMLVTCRTNEYIEGVAQFGVLPQAVVVELAPVTVDDAVVYLTEREAEGSDRWRPVITSMMSSPDGPLATALATPLTLSLARQVFQSPKSDPAELTRMPSVEAVKRLLLSRFLPTVFGGAHAGRAARWLTCLIRVLSAHPRDPNLGWWRLASAIPRSMMLAAVTAVVSVLGAALFFGLWAFATYSYSWLSLAAGGALSFPIGLAVGLQAARAARPHVLAARRPGWSTSTVLRIRQLSLGFLIVCAGGALAFSILVATGNGGSLGASVMQWLRDPRGRTDANSISAITITLAIVVTLVISASRLNTRSGIPHRSTPSLRSFPQSLRRGFGLGMAVGLPWTAVAWLSSIGPADWPRLPTWVGLWLTAASLIFVGVPVALGRWLRSPIDEQDSQTPDAALRGDRRALLASAGSIGGITALIAVVAILCNGWPPGQIGVAAGLWVAAVVTAIVFFGSGSAWLGYMIARFVLAAQSRLPWRLTRFLNTAHAAGVLRQAGSYYQIRHDMLRTYLLSSEDSNTSR